MLSILRPVFVNAPTVNTLLLNRKGAVSIDLDSAGLFPAFD